MTGLITVNFDRMAYGRLKPFGRVRVGETAEPAMANTTRTHVLAMADSISIREYAMDAIASCIGLIKKDSGGEAWMTRLHAVEALLRASSSAPLDGLVQGQMSMRTVTQQAAQFATKAIKDSCKATSVKLRDAVAAFIGHIVGSSTVEAYARGLCAAYGRKTLEADDDLYSQLMKAHRHVFPDSVTALEARRRRRSPQPTKADRRRMLASNDTVDTENDATIRNAADRDHYQDHSETDNEAKGKYSIEIIGSVAHLVLLPMSSSPFGELTARVQALEEEVSSLREKLAKAETGN